MSNLLRSDATDLLRENGFKPKEIGEAKVDLLFQCMKFQEVVDECYDTKELNKQMDKIVRKIKEIVSKL